MLPLLYHRPLWGFVVSRVRTGDLYDLVRTDLTGKLSKHIYSRDLGPKLPSFCENRFDW